MLEKLEGVKQKPEKSTLPNKNTCFEQVLEKVWIPEEPFSNFHLLLLNVCYILEDSTTPTKMGMYRQVVNIYHPLGLVRNTQDTYSRSVMY